MNEEFEKWAKGEGFDLARWADTDDYADLQTSDAWWVWQASRKQALEEIVSTLQKGGATLPAPPPDGTPESCVRAGMCVALAVVDSALQQ